MSDLWDTISLDTSIAPNQTIQNLQRLKWHVLSRTRKQLVETMTKVEEEMRHVACNIRYEWLKMYARRLYKRKNMLGAKRYEIKKTRSISPVGFVPSPLRTD
jgi:hypothetical protein